MSCTLICLSTSAENLVDCLGKQRIRRVVRVPPIPNYAIGPLFIPDIENSRRPILKLAAEFIQRSVDCERDPKTNGIFKYCEFMTVQAAFPITTIAPQLPRLRPA